MKTYTYFLFILLLTLLNSCVNTGKKEAACLPELYTDRVIDNNRDMPLMFPFVFNSENNRISAKILTYSFRNPAPTVIFLHGNPGYEKQEDIGQALRRGGMNAVFFSYSGTWGNEGIFSYKNCITDLEYLIEYLKEKADQYKIDTNNIFLCGHSMGADIVLLNNYSNIKGIIAIDPWNGYQELNKKTEKEISEYIENLEGRFMLNILSAKDFVTDIINVPSLNLEEKLKENSLPILFVFHNKVEKNKIPENLLNTGKRKYIILNAFDHSFSDKRIELTNNIYEWIKNTI